MFYLYIKYYRRKFQNIFKNLSHFFIVYFQDDDFALDRNETSNVEAVISKNTTTDLDETSSIDENDIDVEETISGENDVEYVEFSMTQRMPTSQNSAANSTINGNIDEHAVLDEELMLLSLFDDSPSNVNGQVSLMNGQSSE